jgi:hypothetical protein
MMRLTDPPPWYTLADRSLRTQRVRGRPWQGVSMNILKQAATGFACIGVAACETSTTVRAAAKVVAPPDATMRSSAPFLECPDIPGLDQVIKPGKLVFFGEIHGTNEAPAFIADATCVASRQGRVHVGLELPVSDELALQTFFADDGEAGLRDAKFWRSPYQDGRSSKAMLALLKRLREYRRAGAPIEVFLFDEVGRVKPEQREAAMAENISRRRQRAPSDLYLIQVGNYHARRVAGAPWNPSAPWLASILAPQVSGMITLDMRTLPGTAWICSGATSDTCGVRPIKNIANTSNNTVDIAVKLEPQHGGAYDGTFSVGRITASPPAFRSKD